MSEYLKKVLVVELHNFHFQMCFSIYFQFQSTFLEIIVLAILMLSPSPLLFIVHNSPSFLISWQSVQRKFRDKSVTYQPSIGLGC